MMTDMRSGFARRFAVHALMLSLSLVAVFPVFWMVVSSLKPENEILSARLWPMAPSLDNYVFVLTQIPMLRMLANTTIVAAATAVLQVVTGLLAAYAFVRWRFRLSKVAHGLISLSWLVPFQIVMLVDADRTYFPTKLITTGIVYNTNAPFVPASWKDLTRPEAKGLIAMPSPLTSGAAMIHTVTLTGNLSEGWDFYAALAENNAQAGGGNGDVLKAVSGGDKLFGMIVDFMPIREKAKGAPVEFVFPEEGVSAVTEPVAILSTAANPEAAKAFVDFLISGEGQKLAVEQGYIPARADAGLPEGYPDRSAIKVLTYDAAAALAGDMANKEKFAEVMGQ